MNNIETYRIKFSEARKRIDEGIEKMRKEQQKKLNSLLKKADGFSNDIIEMSKIIQIAQENGFQFRMCSITKKSDICFNAPGHPYMQCYADSEHHELGFIIVEKPRFGYLRNNNSDFYCTIEDDHLKWDFCGVDDNIVMIEYLEKFLIDFSIYKKAFYDAIENFL